jgi:nucleoside-diphosphate-sugar epimerase
MFKKKQILILGSRGQIGTHLLNYLNKRYLVKGIDIVNSSKEDLRLNKNFLVERLIKKSDFIFFLAFDVGGSKYLKNYQYSYQFLMNNIKIMQNVFHLIKNNNKKFIFATSQMSNMNHSTYGILKKIGEYLTQSLGGLNVRFWNIYGVEEDVKKFHVISDFITKGMKSKNVKMRTDGKEVRDFLYAEDCCVALELMMNKYNFFKKRKTIDLNTGKNISIKNISKIISKLFLIKKNRKVIFLPSKEKDTIQQNKKNKSDGYFFKFWKPKYAIDLGIEKIFDHYTKN